MRIVIEFSSMTKLYDQIPLPKLEAFGRAKFKESQ